MYMIIILWISLEKGECFDFNHSLGCVYPTLYIIRLLRRVYHFSWLICYPSSSFKSLIKDPTCFKNPENPSCIDRIIDLILTNSPCSFQKSCVTETGLSDFHKMIVSVMKTTFQKLKPRIAQYSDYTQFPQQ